MLKGRMVFIGSPRAMKKGLGPIIKEAFMDAGAMWHRRYLPRHFEEGAGNKYKYQRRTKLYLRDKERSKGHRRPLEFTGDLKRAVLRKAALSGTAKRVRVTLDTGVAWYATANMSKRPSMPDMPVELTKTVNAEVRRLAKLVEQYTTRRLNAIETRETRA